MTKIWFHRDIRKISHISPGPAHVIDTWLEASFITTFGE